MAELAWPVPPLGDEVVAMRPWRAADVPAQLKAFSDPFFQRFSDWAPRTQDPAVRTLAEQEHARQRGEQIELAPGASHDDRVVFGGASLHDVDLCHPRGRASRAYAVQGRPARQRRVRPARRRAALAVVKLPAPRIGRGDG